MKQNDDLLDPQLSGKLAALKNVPERNPQAAARGRANFLQEAASLAPTVVPAREKPAGRNSDSGFLAFFGRKPAALLARLALIIVLAAGLLGAGGAAAVYAARESLPGDTLYPVKTWGEDVQLTFATNPQADFELNLQFAERRLGEISAITEGNEELAAQAMLRLEKHLQNALQASFKMEGEQALTAMERVRKALESQQQLMQQLQKQAPPAQKQKLEQNGELLQQEMQYMENMMQQEQVQQQNQIQNMQPTGSGQAGQPGEDVQHQTGEQQQGQDSSMQPTPQPQHPVFTITPTPFMQGGPNQFGNGNYQGGGEITPMPKEQEGSGKK